MAKTFVTDLIIPEVIGDSVRKKMGNLIKLAPLAEVDGNLQGQAGNSITLPSWNYIGEASDVAEGVQITPEKISAGAINVSVKKAVKDIAMTDESVLATNGEVVGEVEHQLAVSIANKIDADMFAQAQATATSADVPQIGQQLASATLDQAGLAQLRIYFGEELEDTYLVINTAEYAKILSMPEFVSVGSGQGFMTGHVGHVMGLNIVVSGRCPVGTGVLLQRGGLGLAIKRNVNTESDRDMSTRSTTLGVDAHYACYVKNPAKVANIASIV